MKNGFRIKSFETHVKSFSNWQRLHQTEPQILKKLTIPVHSDWELNFDQSQPSMFCKPSVVRHNYDFVFFRLCRASYYSSCLHYMLFVCPGASIMVLFPDPFDKPDWGVYRATFWSLISLLVCLLKNFGIVEFFVLALIPDKVSLPSANEDVLQ